MSEHVACRACGKAVDPLRARAVSIVLGRFAYFCDTTCKLQVQSPDFAETLRPPRVATQVQGARTTPLPVEGTIDAAASFRVAGEPTAAADDASAVSAAASVPTLASGDVGPEPEGWFSPAPALQFTASRPAEPVLVVPEPALAGLLPTNTSAAELGRRPVQFACMLLAVLSFACTGAALVPAAAGVLLIGGPATASASALLLLVLAYADRSAPRAPYALVAPTALLLVSAVAILGGQPLAARFAAAAACAAWLAVGASYLAVQRERRARAQLLAQLGGEYRVDRDGVRYRELAPRLQVGDHLVLRAGEYCPVDATLVSATASLTHFAESREVVTASAGALIPIFARVVAAECTVRCATPMVASAGYVSLVGTSDSSPKVRRGSRIAAALVAAFALASMLVAYTQGAGREVMLLWMVLPIFVLAPDALWQVWTNQLASARRNALVHGVVFANANALMGCVGCDSIAFLGRSIFLAGAPSLLVVDPIGKQTRDAVVRELLAFGFFLAPAASAQLLREAENLGVDRTYAAPQLGKGPVVLDHQPEFGARIQTAKGDLVTLGTRAYLLSLDIAIGAADERENQGDLAVYYLVHERRPTAILVLEDAVRSGAAAGVAVLEGAEIEPILFTREDGDASRALAAMVGIEHVRADVIGSEAVDALADLADTRPGMLTAGLAGAHADALVSTRLHAVLGGLLVAGASASVATCATDSVYLAHALVATKLVAQRLRKTMFALGGTGLSCGLLAITGYAPLWTVPILGVVLTIGAVGFGATPAAWLTRRARS
jgi:cation transport ATPase